MAEIRLTKVEQGHTKIRNVPIAVTPEGFWCCPSPAVFQKTVKTQNSTLNKAKSSSPPPPKPSGQRKHSVLNERKLQSESSRAPGDSDDHKKCGSEMIDVSASMGNERLARPKVENAPRKVAIEFGEPETSDLKVVLRGKQGFCVKLTVHKSVLVENSRCFADKLSEKESTVSCLDIDDCEDVEIYVETVGLMYCKDMKQRLIKQSVSRVLRILKVSELLSFDSCIQSCLEYLEAVPWVGEEEEKVVTSVLRLQSEGIGVTPILKRVASDACGPPNDTLSHIIELVRKSNDERGRREMKNTVLKLLRENNSLPGNTGSTDICIDTICRSCRSCLDSLLSFFKQAIEQELANKPMDTKESAGKQIALEADNVLWLLEILADRQAADEFAVMWAGQRDLAAVHTKLPVVSRYHVSRITARLFVGIGRGELLPSKDTRHLLLETWLQPLINDYSWLQNGRSFDRKLVDEGIGRTVLTLPLEDQQSILLAWLGSFLKFGDNCPNLQRAFEVWWRRTFIRPHMETQTNIVRSDSSTTSKQET